jgi:ASCH domain
VKGLIIREPWITKILNGEKTWEMRPKVSHYRGPIALIPKDSDELIGVVEMIDSLPELRTLEAYAEAFEFHRVPPESQASAFSARWRIPWVLRDARALIEPVRYKRRKGPVAWVLLDEDTIREIRSRDPLI